MNPDIGIVILTVFKYLIIFGLGLYIVFASVILRQEQLMAHVLEESFEPVLRFASFLHLLASVAVFLLAILIL